MSYALNQAIELYCQWAYSKYTPRTLYIYQQLLNRFSACIGNKKVGDITVQDFIAYHRQLKNRDKLLDSTIAGHMIALRSFWLFLYNQQLVTIHHQMINVPKYVNKGFTPANKVDLLQLITAVNKANDSDKIRTRDALLLNMLYSTGARISEVLSLNLGDLHLADRYAVIITRKNRKRRQIFWDAATEVALLQHIDERQDSKSDDPLFIALDKRTYGDRLTSRSAQRIVRRYTRLAGLSDNITPHSFRHGLAMDSVHHDIHPRIIQLLLGHNSIVSSQIYMDVKNDDLHEQYKKLAIGR